MVSNTSEHPRPAFTRQRLAVAIALGSCALALACIPAATAAKPDHGRLTPSAAESKTVGGSPDNGPADHGHQQALGRHEPQHLGTHEQQGHAGHEPQQAGTHEQQDHAGHEAQQTGNYEQQDHAGREQHVTGNHELDSGNHERQDSGSHQQDPASHEQQDAPNQGAQPRGDHERRDAGKRQQNPGNHESGNHESGVPASHTQVNSASHKRGREQQDPARSSHAPRSRAASGGPTVISAPPTSAPVPSSPPKSSPATISPQAPVASPTAATRGLPHAVRHFRQGQGRRHGGVVSRGLTRKGSPPRAVAPVAALAVTPVHTAPAGRARSATHRAPRHAGPSPIVTTITKIVGVVPTAVRILIGALLALALALGVRSRLVALRARRLERQRGELLEDVGLLQAALLPLTPARLGPVGTSAAYRPADGPGAGGDFYDVFALGDGQLAVIVGDVSGHGRQALPHTALVRFTLRAYLEAGLSPRDAVQTAGAVLESQLGGSFATVVAATYQPRDRRLVYACAGHPPPIVLGSKPVALITVCSSPPIGVGMRTGIRQTVVSVPGWSQLCFHTDGVTEARMGSELFGAERLTRTLATLGPQATASALLERVVEETTARPDDMAACLLRVEGGADAPTVLVEQLELDHNHAASDRTERFLLMCGVEQTELADLMRSAQAVAGRAGTVLLELRLADGPPEIALRRANIAFLHSPSARRRAGLGVSR
jgi:serine phosphatase RsbU (regulator of sigma subunit)